MEKEKNNKSTVGGMVLVGCLMIGIGLGFYYQNIVVGLFIGLGVGFIGMAIAWALLKQK